MLDKMTNGMDFHAKALVLRAERQRALAGNIANADTPGYQARDFNFAQALSQATGQQTGGSAHLTVPSSSASSGPAAGMTHSRHMALPGLGGGADGRGDAPSGYAAQTQPSLDGNTVDLDRERAAFADNAVRYEATLRFINGQSRTMLSAIQGQ